MKKIILISIIGLALQLIFLSNEAVYGSSVSKLEKEISSLDKENRQIESEIASLTSFFSISQKIAENSLTATEQIENEAVAYKR
jgi:hypothetical protein